MSDVGRTILARNRHPGGPTHSQACPSRAEQARSMITNEQLASFAAIGLGNVPLPLPGRPPTAQEVAGRKKIATAIAIALAESGGPVPGTKARLKACRLDTNGFYSRGPWQINGVHSQYDNYGMFDGQRNAEAMATLSKRGTDWSPWSTYKNKTYLARMPEAMLALASGGFAQDPGRVEPGLHIDPLAGILGILGQLTKGSTWIRIGEVVMGAVLLLVGLVFISRDLGLGGVEGMAKKVPGIGLAVRAVEKVKG